MVEQLYHFQETEHVGDGVIEDRFVWGVDSDDSWGDYGDGTDMYDETHHDDRKWFIRFWKKVIADGKEQELIDYISDIWDIDLREGRECEKCGECWSKQELNSYAWHCLKCGHKIGD